VLAVAEQDTMVEFFVDKLGFEIRTDAEMWPGAFYIRVTDPEGRNFLVNDHA
jgi:hypothetical protein